MKHVNTADEAVNAANLKPGSRIYCAGNAATPQLLLKQLVADESIREVEMLGVLLLGDIDALFSEPVCGRITHRVIFNSHHSRQAVNRGWAQYQLMHLSDIPRQLRESIRPDTVLLSVSGPDRAGNYSLGTTVEGLKSAVQSAKARGGLVIAERNARMPFILGAMVHEKDIDYLIDSDYPLPESPVKLPDERSRRIGEIIAGLYLQDGCTLQYGIGEVPEAVTDAIIARGLKDLGIHTELFADAMRKLIDEGIVTNRYTRNNATTATLFLSKNQDGYDWMHFNCSIQSRTSTYTNDVRNIARQPLMVAVNSAIGVDLHGNIWADSLQARHIYSGVGGQADFLRGAYLSEGGKPIIALKSTTPKGIPKILDRCPEGITTTAIAADPVIIVTEHGAFDPRGLSLVEHAVAIAHLADPDTRDFLLKYIYDSEVFHNPTEALRDGAPKGFTPYEAV
jgi:4-hydroxybutyrate CoA-transferase